MQIEIGGVIIEIKSRNERGEFSLDEAYEPFLSYGKSEVVLSVHYGDLPHRRLSEKTFDTQTSWKMFRSNGEYIVKHSRRAAILKSNFTSGKIFIKSRHAKTMFPLMYPLAEIIMINLLARGRGIVVHACGIKESKKKGWLFAGSSQAGKSTTANLWKKEKDITILSDDRIIVRKMENRFWMYGTPWHGDAKEYSSQKATLEKIFFLRHSKKNILRKIPPREALSRLMVCTFPTFWDKNGMKFTLGFCAGLVERIPCYELNFVPDESAVDFIQGL